MMILHKDKQHCPLLQTKCKAAISNNLHHQITTSIKKKLKVRVKLAKDQIHNFQIRNFYNHNNNSTKPLQQKLSHQSKNKKNKFSKNSHNHLSNKITLKFKLRIKIMLLKKAKSRLKMSCKL
jgi:hypothetical protein